MDVEKIRKDFPLLQKAVYLDNAATSLCPEPVLQKMLEYYHDYKANIHRGAHRLSERATQEYEAVYGKLGKFFNANPDGFIHTKNASEAINLVALGLNWKKDANIATTSIEHHSNLLPWMRLRDNKTIAELRFVKPIDKQGHFDLEDFKKAIDSKTQLVAITGASNVLGNKMPVAEITEIAHEKGALVLLDAAQMAGHFSVDFKRIGADFVAIAGHKMLAPSGTGVLYHNGEFQSPMLGGGMIRSVSLDNFELMPGPQGEEAGTPNIAGVIGFGAAIDYLNKTGLRDVESHEQKLVSKMLDGLRSLDAEIYGPLDAREKTGVVAFNFKGIPAHQVAVMADQLARVCIRSGHHCAMPLHKFLGVEGSVRASVHFYNNESDVDALLNALKKISFLK